MFLGPLSLAIRLLEATVFLVDALKMSYTEVCFLSCGAGD